MAKKSKALDPGKAAVISYSPEPTSEQFHRSNAKYLGLCSAVGQGKTTSVLIQHWFNACQQNIHPQTKIRESIVMVARSTYPELKSIVAREIKHWFQPIITHESYDNPHSIVIECQDPDPYHAKMGVTIRLEFILLALDEATAEDKVKSFNVSWGWLNEADTVSKKAFDAMQQRCDRTPPPIDEPNPHYDPNFPDGFDTMLASRYTVEEQKEHFINPKFIRTWPGNAYGGIVMEWNPCSTEHWVYQMMEVEGFVDPITRQKISKVFHIPPPLKRKEGDHPGGYFYRGYTYFKNPMAEGVRFQTSGLGYWYNYMQGKDDDVIRRYILGEYTSSLGGKPVFTTFDPKKHIATSTIEYSNHRDILCVCDWGHHAAILFCQVDDFGELMILDEFYNGAIGLKKLLRDDVRPVLKTKYAGASFRVIGDPSGQMSKNEDLSPFLWVKQFFFDEGYEVQVAKAKTNSILARYENTNTMLVNETIKIDPGCTFIIGALGGNYRYEETKTPGVFKNEPIKDIYSHLADDVMYACVEHQTGDMDTKGKGRKLNNQGNGDHARIPRNSGGRSSRPSESYGRDSNWR